MNFKDKLKLRLYLAIAYIVGGLVMILVFNITETGNEYLSSMGLALMVVGIARIRNYRLITKNEETIRKQEIAETDERNLAIANKAKSTALTIFVMLLCAAIIVLQILSLSVYVLTLSGTLCTLLLIYWVSYWIIRKRS